MTGAPLRLLCGRVPPLGVTIGICLQALLAASGPVRAATVANPAQALEQAEKRLGPASAKLLPLLDARARQRFRAGEVAAAMALRRHALKIAIGAFGPFSPPAVEAMAALAALYLDMRRYLDAEPLLIAASNALSGRSGPDDPALVPILSGLARVALARGDAGLARRRAERALAIAKAERQPAARRSQALRALARVLARDKRSAESERLLRRALALTGEDNLAAARSLRLLGSVYLQQKRFAAALLPLEKAAAIDQGRLGSSHPWIADDFYYLGIGYLQAGRLADAGRALRFAIRVLRRGAGNGTPRLAYAELVLARVDRKAGHADKAEALFDRAKRILDTAAREEQQREARA